MHITYQNPGFEHSIESILLFQTEDQTPFWSDSILYFYPQIKKEELAKRNPADKKKYLYDAFRAIYEAAKEELDSKVCRYQDHFLKHQTQIEDALSEAFEVETRAVYNDLTANVTLNPVCPRFLKERYFDAFYLNSERGALGLSLHEVIHYFWFDVWNHHFGDDYSEYETPSLKWILSEMVVEAIMSDPRLCSINPYYPRENGGCVYPYFQTMKIEGMPVLEQINRLYQANRITDFMEVSYAYCVKHEQAIRYHMTESEKAF